MTSVGVISTSVVQIAVVSLVPTVMDPQVAVFIYSSHMYIFITVHPILIRCFSYLLLWTMKDSSDLLRMPYLLVQLPMLDV